MNRDINKILTQHWQEVCVQTREDKVQSIMIRRKNMLKIANNLYNQNTFNARKQLRVTFLGEAGVDTGGPRCEFFTVVLQEIRTTLFEGKAGSALPVNNLTYVGQKLFHTAGVILAQCLLQEHVSIVFISSYRGILLVWNFSIASHQYSVCHE